MFSHGACTTAAASSVATISTKLQIIEIISKKLFDFLTASIPSTSPPSTALCSYQVSSDISYLSDVPPHPIVPDPFVSPSHATSRIGPRAHTIPIFRHRLKNSHLLSLSHSRNRPSQVNSFRFQHTSKTSSNPSQLNFVAKKSFLPSSHFYINLHSSL